MEINTSENGLADRVRTESNSFFDVESNFCHLEIDPAAGANRGEAIRGIYT